MKKFTVFYIIIGLPAINIKMPPKCEDKKEEYFPILKIIQAKQKALYYTIVPGNNSEIIKKCMARRSNWKENNNTGTFNFKWQHISTGLDYTSLTKHPLNLQIVNHFEFHSMISNKLNLFQNMMRYCESNGLEIFNYIPFTIIMQYDSPSFKKQFEKFSEFFEKIEDKIYPGNKTQKYADIFRLDIHSYKEGYKTFPFIPKTHYDKKNMWLVKAIDMNRGRCIKIGDSIEGIKKIIQKFNDGIFRDIKESEEEEIGNIKKKKILDFKKYKASCVLVQKYIEKPLLYYGRKFDIRMWVLFDHINSVFVFKEGHLKTSSTPYNINLKDSFIHLTNYSVQKYNKEFSKYEYGNEVSFKSFQDSIDREYGGEKSVEDIFIKIKELIKMTAGASSLNMNNRKYSFEIFGYDFILDKEFNVYLLEINTNPGLEESSPLIRMLVPRMIDDALKLTVDKLFSKQIDEYSPYSVEGYLDNENLWDFVTNYS